MVYVVDVCLNVHVYTHIDLVSLVFMKSGDFYMKTGTFCEKHMKSTEN